MKLLFLAVSGGALGSGLRYIVNRWVTLAVGSAFPWGIFVINVTGCFIMGLLAGYLALRDQGNGQELRVFLGTGILGGYTTFSAFSLDFANLVRAGDHVSAAGYLVGSVGLALAGVFLGLALSRTLFS